MPLAATLADPVEPTDAADDFFPTFADLLQALDGSSGQARVPVAFLKFLITGLLEGRPFDEVYYAAANPDVAAAVERGDTPSLHWHYVNVGYFEGRRGHQLSVDADWYLRNYPDIARAFARGQIDDLTQHLNETGRFEGRTGSARQQAQLERWMEQFRTMRAG